jgi:hypothetical protein
MRVQNEWVVLHVSISHVTRVDGLKHFILQREIAIFYINRRMVYAMRSIDCGQSSMSRFCSTMNMPPPVGSQPFREHTKAILRAAKDVAEQTIKDAEQKSTTPRLRLVKIFWKGIYLIARMRNRHFHGKWKNVGHRTLEQGLQSMPEACIISTLVPKQLLKSSKPLVINPGAFCVAGVREVDRLRVTKSNYKAGEKNKVPRKATRGRNKRKGDKNEVEEGKTYAAGSF